MRRAWRGGAPRTSHALPHFISAFTLSYVPLLDSLFAPFPSFFFSLCFVIPMLYLLCQRNPTPLPLLFLSSRAVQPRLTDISISTFVALSNFTLHFYPITFREVAPLYIFSLPLIPPLQFSLNSLEFHLDQSFIYVCQFIIQTEANGKAAGYYQNRCCKIPAPAFSIARHSENCFFGRLPSPPI